MTIDREHLRAVLDTNVLLAGLLRSNPQSPTVELITRWRSGEFDLIYSRDLQREYAEKLDAKQVDRAKADRFLAALVAIGIRAEVALSDVERVIPDDPDDDLVVACAVGGRADYIVTYDPHFDPLGGEYQGIKILDGLHFLYVVRGDVKPAAC